MEKKIVIKAVKLALKNMNQDYCKLSKLVYDNIEASDFFIKILSFFPVPSR